MDPEEELVDILDEENNVLGKSTRKEAHQKGHIHRALSVLVLNSKGQILLQRRSKNKSVHALSWDLSTSEHVLSGESYIDAAKRSLKEELGIKSDVIKASEITFQKREYELPEGKVFEYEFAGAFVARHEGPFKIDETEVDSVKFFEIKEIEDMIESSDYDFTPWFLDNWEEVNKILSSSRMRGSKK